MAAIHPTKEALISTVVTLMEGMPVSEITSEQVLEVSKISRGSLYHHFHDFSELIEDAQVRRFANYIDASIAALWQILASTTSRDELVEKVHFVTRQTQGSIVPRMHRVEAIALTANNPRMLEKLGAEQERLTESITDLYREVCNRGWGNEALEPRAVAILIQAYSLGKVVDDFTPHKVDLEKWIELINAILATVLFPAKG